MTTRRKVPILTPEQIALHGGISDPKNARLFSLDAAVALYADYPDALKRAREHRRLAHEFLKAAQTPGIAALPRVTLTVESVYLCALAALGAAGDNYKHPSREALVTGARLAGLSKKQIDAIADCLEYRYEPAGIDAQWQLPLDLLTKAAKTMLKTK